MFILLNSSMSRPFDQAANGDAWLIGGQLSIFYRPKADQINQGLLVIQFVRLLERLQPDHMVDYIADQPSEPPGVTLS